MAIVWSCKNLNLNVLDHSSPCSLSVYISIHFISLAHFRSNPIRFNTSHLDLITSIITITMTIQSVTIYLTVFLYVSFFIMTTVWSYGLYSPFYGGGFGAGARVGGYGYKGFYRPIFFRRYPFKFHGYSYGYPYTFAF